MIGGRAVESPAQRGIALIVVLWLVALLALMAVSQTAAVRTETQIVGNRIESAAARAAAYAGMQLAIAGLTRPLPAREMSADATLYTLNFDSAKLFISIADESGKVDLNAAPASLLGALLEVGGVEEETQRESLVAAILDWRDRDNLRRVNGAEEEEYRNAGLDYAPRNGPFQSLEELALVLGFTAPLYHALESSLTIYSGISTVNTSASPAAVLQALESSADSEEFIPDDPGDNPETHVAVRGRGNSAAAYSIFVEAHLDSGVRERVEAVVRLIPARANAPMRYQFLRWREGVMSRLPVGG